MKNDINLSMNSNIGISERHPLNKNNCAFLFEIFLDIAYQDSPSVVLSALYS
jgi:hypothetical protein